MEEINPRLTVSDVFGYALAYACWFITAMLSMLGLLVSRNSLNLLWPLLGGSRWVLRAVDRFGLVFLGLVWLVYVIFTEHTYRSSIWEARVKRARARARPATQPSQAKMDSFTRFLRKLGLDILTERVVPTVALPLALLILTYWIESIVLTSLL